MQAGKLQPSNQQTYHTWANRLRQWGLHQLTAALLEAGGPLNLVSAQLVHIGQPVLGSFVAKPQLDALADLLEEPDQTRAFVECLREDSE